MNKWGGLESHLVVLPYHVIVPRKETGTNYVFSLPDPIADHLNGDIQQIYH
jgi:hypothetical protein